MSFKRCLKVFLNLKRVTYVPRTNIDLRFLLKVQTSLITPNTTRKPSTVWITINCGKFWKRWEYQTTWPTSWETCIQVRKQQLELAMEQQTGSKQEKEYIKAVYCHPAYLTFICRVHHEKRWAGRSKSWNRDCQEEYQ